MSKPEININVLTQRRLTSKEEGQTLFRTLIECSPLLVPERYGYGEPIREIFDANNLDAILAYWGRGICWRRSRPKTLGMASCNYVRWLGPGWITCDFTKDFPQPPILVELMLRWSIVFEANFAAIHISTDDERNLGYKGIITEHQIKNRLPDIYWGVVFGEPYIQLFGREQLLTCPAFEVRELASGAIYVQLTQSIHDILERREEFLTARTAAKAHLNSNAFFSPDLPEDHVYNIPTFHYPELCA